MKTILATFFSKKSVLLLSSISIGTLYLALISFVEAWIWSPVWSLILLWAIIVADLISAVLASINRNGGFDSNKAKKAFVTMGGHTLLLGVVFNFPRVNELFGPEEVQSLLDKFPAALYMTLFVYLLASLLKNLVLAEAINGNVAKWIYKYIDTYKNQLGDKFWEDVEENG